jgi:uncharacterized protein (DUF924 family)
MNGSEDWRTVHEFWFPPGLDADFETHRQMFRRWFGGEVNTELPPFLPLLEGAKTGRLGHWRAQPLGRLSLIIVLDQFARSLFAGTPEAYASDGDALRIAMEGLCNGHYEALTKPWERMFFFMPLAHTEGPDHRERLERVIAMAQTVALEAPERVKPLYQFSVGQARGHLEVISRFGRFPHRNPVLARASTPEELAYLEKGDFVHRRGPPG